jgi:hypothetical protein
MNSAATCREVLYDPLLPPVPQVGEMTGSSRRWSSKRSACDESSWRIRLSPYPGFNVNMRWFEWEYLVWIPLSENIAVTKHAIREA